MHLEENSSPLQKGNKIQAGDRIDMGNTGGSTAKHLHYAERNRDTNQWINPESTLDNASSYDSIQGYKTSYTQKAQTYFILTILMIIEYNFIYCTLHMH
jgi:hypothetical protein